MSADSASVESTPLPPTPEAAGRPDRGGGLWSVSFVGLMVTQFLVALNDNMFRWLLIPIGKDLIGEDNARTWGAMCFLVPFVLLAAPAGYLADRFSKRNVMIGCKVAEIVVMILGTLVILSGEFHLMLIVLFLMGAQSAMFSPSKYGSIPEIVREDRISAANGVIGMTTMFACILGTVAGGYLYNWTTISSGQTWVPGEGVLPGQHRWWISATALIGVAVVGWIASLLIGRLEPASPERRFPVNPAAQTIRDLAALIARRPLLVRLGTLAQP